MVYIKDLDNRKKVSKEIISHIQELLSKKDFNGNPLSTIRLCKIRNVDNSNLDSDDLIKSIFNEGLIDSGDVITESNTTSIIKSIKDVLATFRTNDEGYSGYIILEIPSRFFQNNELKKEYEEELYKEDTSYLTIEPTYIDSYISINDRNYNLYSKEYFKKSKVKK